MEIEVSKTDLKISDATGFSESDVAIIKNTVCKGATNTELAYFLNVCRTVNLNPFNKEIWSYKDNKGNLLIFTGRDGFLAKAQESPLYNGIRSSEICTSDEIEIDIPNGIIHHKIKPTTPRGNILGAYAIVFRKNGEPTIEYADFDTYNKGYNVWKSDPASMIKKVAESHALKKAFGISGVQPEYDFDFNQSIATPLQKVNKPHLKELLPYTDQFNNAILAVKNGASITALRNKYLISDDVEQQLIEKSNESL